ncbi:MAG: hypothetical protein QOI95_1482 [Acidimicrobiaceae bacterium]|jgi:uncharacterized RDD family membrane protein YckC
MTEPLVWPTAPPTAPPREPPTDFALPPPPPEERRRPVASIWTRAGEFGLEVVLMACTFGFGWVGWWIVAWGDGQSPAKVVLHLHVVNASDGRLASFGRTAVREVLGKGVPAAVILAGAYFRLPGLAAIGAAYLAASVAVAAVDARRRTLWDRVAGTVVLVGDPPPDPPPMVATPPAEASTTLG